LLVYYAKLRNIYLKVTTTFENFILDDYQGINPLQFRLTKPESYWISGQLVRGFFSFRTKDIVFVAWKEWRK
jgi:hypothetical protein